MTLQEAVAIYTECHERKTENCERCPLTATAAADHKRSLCGLLEDAEFIANYYVKEPVYAN